MKSTFSFSIALLLLFSFFISCKKENTITATNDKTPNDKKRANSAHVAINANGGYFRFSGTNGGYIPVNGTAGNNIIRNAATGVALLNVTGITTDHAIPTAVASICLSRPNNTSNWEIWKFPILNPNQATLSATIPNSATKRLTDIEFDRPSGKFYCLNRVSGTATNAVQLSGSLVIQNEVAITIIPNVDGLSMKPGADLFVCGQSTTGNIGYISALGTNLLPSAGWTTANSIYTTPTSLVPYGVDIESGFVFDILSTGANNFMLGGNAPATIPNRWTRCGPINYGGSGTTPPIIANWIPSTIPPSTLIGLIDMSLYD